MWEEYICIVCLEKGKIEGERPGCRPTAMKMIESWKNVRQMKESIQKVMELKDPLLSDGK